MEDNGAKTMCPVCQEFITGSLFDRCYFNLDTPKGKPPATVAIGGAGRIHLHGVSLLGDHRIRFMIYNKLRNKMRHLKWKFGRKDQIHRHEGVTSATLKNNMIIEDCGA